MNILSNLTSLVKKRKRVGRGGDRGGTSGKGHKGQKARSGPSIGPVFEGGQMPLTRRLPKRGFTNAPFKKEFEVVNLSRLDAVFAAGETVNKEALVAKRIIKNPKLLVKILGTGVIEKNLVIHADAFSKTALQAISAAGGEGHIIKER